MCGDTSAVDQYQEEDDFAEQDALGAGLIVDQGEQLRAYIDWH